jgi:hypothetical protein
MKMSLEKKVNLLMVYATASTLILSMVILSSFDGGNKKLNLDELTVKRINVVDKNNIMKICISSNDYWGKERGWIKNPSFSGVLFYNEEGQETGGLTWDGKKTKMGQDASSGLMFDQYNQDQNVALQHLEYVDSTSSSISDGLAINQRPDFRKKSEEFNIYDTINKINLTREQRDSVLQIYASKGFPVFSRRIFVGVKRGIAKNQPFNDAGLFIKNKSGVPVIKIFVDHYNVPHFEVYDSLGKKKIYALDIKK